MFSCNLEVNHCLYTYWYVNTFAGLTTAKRHFLSIYVSMVFRMQPNILTHAMSNIHEE